MAIGLSLVLLGYVTPYLSVVASRRLKEKIDQGERIRADRVGAWIMFGGFVILGIGLLNLMQILP